MLLPPGSLKPAGPVQLKLPGGGETVIVTEIKPLLSPAQDSFAIESIVMVEAEESFIVAAAESRQPKSSVTVTK